MEYLLLVAISVVLLLVAYQDFRIREFYWFLAPAVFVLGVSKGVLAVNIKYWAIITSINVLIIIITFTAFFIYFLVTKKSGTSIRDLIGTGDVLLLVSLTGLVLPKTYIMLILSSSLVAIVFQLMVKTRFGNRIPFAGWLSVMAIFFLIFEHIK